jgi:hypothetical protein
MQDAKVFGRTLDKKPRTPTNALNRNLNHAFSGADCRPEQAVGGNAAQCEQSSVPGGGGVRVDSAEAGLALRMIDNIVQQPEKINVEVRQFSEAMETLLGIKQNVPSAH